MFEPARIGNVSIDKSVLKADRKKCQKIGPCGIGREAVYLNSFFLSRQYYVAIPEIRRIFKRVALSRGAYTGRGIFGSIPYLVVELTDGRQKQCNFKFENQVDLFIQRFHELWPNVPIYSKKAEEALEQERLEEERSYLKELSPAVQKAVDALGKAKAYLERRPSLYKQLTDAAKFKRSIDHIGLGYKIAAGCIVLAGAVSCVYGVYRVILGTSAAFYFILFGAAAIIYALALRVLPTKRNNRAYAQKQWEQAVRKAAEYTALYPSFPVPACYAHPAVLSRMARFLRQGKAQTIPEAYALLKEDLKAANRSVKVKQTDYDEIIAIKPMFLVMDYKD